MTQWGTLFAIVVIRTAFFSAYLCIGFYVRGRFSATVIIVPYRCLSTSATCRTRCPCFSGTSTGRALSCQLPIPTTPGTGFRFRTGFAYFSGAATGGTVSTTGTGTTGSFVGNALSTRTGCGRRRATERTLIRMDARLICTIRSGNGVPAARTICFCTISGTMTVATVTGRYRTSCPFTPCT